jgi:flagellar hook protein FlgE
MGFQQGLSGLNAASKSLETIGNNVANANTVGFKQSETQFADVYASSLTGAGGSNIGIGVKVAQVSQQFTQGNITSSNNPLDIAINGGGFFRMSNGGTVTYSRNGQFQLDKNGYIVNANGARLTGYTATANGAVASGAPSDLNINTADLAPKATANVATQINLDSRNTTPATAAFNPTDPTSYNNSSSVSVYDTLGNSHVLQTYYVKTGSGTWNVYGTNDGVPIGVSPPTTTASPLAGGAPTSFSAIAAGTFSVNGISIGAVAAGADALTQGANVAAAINAAAIPGVTAAASGATGAVTITNSAAGGTVNITMNGAAATAAAATTNKNTLLAQTGFTSAEVGTQGVQVGTLNFKSDGTIDTATTTLPFSLSISLANGATSPLNVNFDFTGSNQFGSSFGVNKLTQDGYASGQLSGFNVGQDGVITGRYTNGQSKTLGQVVLANFTNPNGLQPLGNNVWAETSASGPSLVGPPNSGGLGVLQSSAVEDSNVDLTAELVNMITAQRVYQANAQTIKTEDQVMQTLVNLR